MKSFNQGAEAESIRDAKNALRKQYKLLRGEILPKLKEQLDREICSLTTALACFRYAKTILMYAPTGSEINILPIAKLAFESKKAVAFPICNPESCTMDFKLVRSLDELSEGQYSILEPSRDAPSVTDFSHSICIVPGLIFDNDGYRIGYGKGYYDRFLNNYNETTLGLVYSDFIVDTLPRGRFDHSVDILVSERGVKVASKTSSQR